MAGFNARTAVPPKAICGACENSFGPCTATCSNIGLFVPFESAWRAVKDFIESDGELPTSIEWIASRDLPPGTFPEA
jgi:hypothetical protein